jgi:hypothetical protein
MVNKDITTLDHSSQEFLKGKVIIYMPIKVSSIETKS